MNRNRRKSLLRKLLVVYIVGLVLICALWWIVLQGDPQHGLVCALHNSESTGLVAAAISGSGMSIVQWPNVEGIGPTQGHLVQYAMGPRTLVLGYGHFKIDYGTAGQGRPAGAGYRHASMLAVMTCYGSVGLVLLASAFGRIGRRLFNHNRCLQCGETRLKSSADAGPKLTGISSARARLHAIAAFMLFRGMQLTAVSGIVFLGLGALATAHSRPRSVFAMVTNGEDIYGCAIRRRQMHLLTDSGVQYVTLRGQALDIELWGLGLKAGYGTFRLKPLSGPAKGRQDTIRMSLWPLAAVTTAFAIICFVVIPYHKRYRCHCGVCSMCGYDLRGSEQYCPECGHVSAGE